ncbi:MAG: DUF5677 domain-containing protein [Nitrosarchaeum sp.]
MMNPDFLTKFEEIMESAIKTLNSYSKSEILQNYFFEILNSLLYANMISNFFDNLTDTNLDELKIERTKSIKLVEELKNIQTSTKLAITDTFNNDPVTIQDYEKFKKIIQNEYPEFKTLLVEIEKKINFKKISTYLLENRKKLEKCGMINPNLDTVIITNVLEIYVKLEHRFPINPNDKILSKLLTHDLIGEFSKNITQYLKKDMMQMLTEQRNYQKEFESRLQQTWKVPIDLLESLIRISIESVQEKEKRKKKNSENSENHKKIALIKIHVRGLQIANEILALIKGGYADGANARWRSLLELSVFSSFLRDNDDIVSLRYMEFDTVKTFRDASDFQKYHQLLGEEPLDEKVLNDLQNEIEQLTTKYGKRYVNSEYGWVPQDIIKEPTFRKISEKVSLDKFYPYYNFASHAVHGGSRGFYRLGLTNNLQNKVMLVGATNYGLADPIQNTAIALSHITGNLLTLDPDFESLIITHTITTYVSNIGTSAVKIQKELEQQYKADDEVNGYFIQ